MLLATVDTRGFGATQPARQSWTASTVAVATRFIICMVCIVHRPFLVGASDALDDLDGRYTGRTPVDWSRRSARSARYRSSPWRNGSNPSRNALFGNAEFGSLCA